MKKFAVFFLALCLLCGLLGCQGEPPGGEPSASSWVAYLEEQEDVQYDAKPVIYLYPEETAQVEVALDYDGGLTHTYPAYGDGWQVTAQPDGTLTDETGREYYCLFWEGEGRWEYRLLPGLLRGGAGHRRLFGGRPGPAGPYRPGGPGVHHLLAAEDGGEPVQSHRLPGEAYTDHARLTVTPEPDTLLRVFMAWQPVEEPVEIPAQELTAPERTGFTVVEWGGVELSLKQHRTSNLPVSVKNPF